MAKPQPAASAQPTRSRPSLDEMPLDFDYLREALGAYKAIATLIGHCSQRLDRKDDSIPMPPSHLASLLDAANTQLDQALNNLDIEQNERRAH